MENVTEETIAVGVYAGMMERVITGTNRVAFSPNVSLSFTVIRATQTSPSCGETSVWFGREVKAS